MADTIPLLLLIPAALLAGRAGAYAASSVLWRRSPESIAAEAEEARLLAALRDEAEEIRAGRRPGFVGPHREAALDFRALRAASH